MGIQESNFKDQNDRLKFKIEFKNRLYRFTLKLIEFIDKIPVDSVSRTLSSQLIRSGTSIIGNYVEARSASSRKDFTNYLNTSLKSANESKLWFSLLKDSNRVSQEDVRWFLSELNEVSNVLASSVLTLKGKR